MSRVSIRTAAVAVGLFVLSSSAARAQTDPTELARGLRNGGHPDLALEYLEDLARKKVSDPAVAAVLPLEKARARLEIAADETDEGKRDVMVKTARAELNQFLTANSAHPRRAEGAIALARLFAIEARGVVSRANRNENEEQRDTERKRARPIFQEAVKRYADAAAALEKLADAPDLTPTQKRAAVTDVYQAELDRAKTLFALADTFGASAADRAERGKFIDQAKALFEALAKKDDKHPLCWVARAWTSECEREKDNPRAVERIAAQIEQAAKQNPAAQAGRRQIAFFTMRAEVFPTGTERPQPPARVQKTVEDWLRANPVVGGRPTAEQFAARYYLGLVKYQQAAAAIAQRNEQKAPPKDPNAKPPEIVIPDAVRPLLVSAEKDFRQLTVVENDYTSRATEKQTQVRRWLVGKADKDPARITDFDEALMTANVLLYNLTQEKAEDRLKKADRVVAMFERIQQLPVAPEDARDAVNARVMQVYVYLLANRPYEAAVLAEHLARSSRYPDPATRAGVYAVQAYLQTAAKAGANDDTTRRVDQARAANVVAFLDKTYPLSSNTDLARLTMGQTLLRYGRPAAAFDLLAKVTQASPRLMAARLLEGAAAFDLLRAQAAGPNEKPLTPAEKGAVYRRVVADLTAVPDLPPTAPAEEANLAVLVELQIAELHILNGAATYATAERSADRALAEATRFTNLDPETKQELILKCKFAKLRAVYAQAVPLFKENNYAQAMAKINPVLADLAKDGPANKPGLPEEAAAVAKRYDDFRRDQVIVLALQARIGEGAVDKAGELFDLLKKLGGSADAIAQALAQLAQAVAPHVAQLRKDMNDAEADKLIAGVGQLLAKVAAEPNISQPALFNLGRAMKDVGSHDKAVEMLTKIKDPGPDLLKKPIAQLTNDERLPVLLYRGAQLELARTRRLARQFDEADKVLRAAMGTKEAKGWAFTAPDFRREAAYLLEDKAEAIADPKAAVAVWREALGKWGEMAGEYLSVLRRPIPKDPTARAEYDRLKAQVKPLYHDIFFESTRCTCRANSSLLKGNAAELTKKFESSARSMVALENANPDMAAEVKAKFTGLLETYPELKQKYTEQQGKAFLPDAATAAGAQ